MLPITRANLQRFCRVCLCDISYMKADLDESKAPQPNKYLPNRMCSHCEVKLCALRQFRCKAIIGTGVLRIIVDEEKLKSASADTPNEILLKLKSICRICLKSQMLHSQSLRDENHASIICEFIGEVSKRKDDILKEDSCFPDRLCTKCHTTIKTFLEFRTISKQTADYLKTVFDDLDIEQNICDVNIVKQEAFSKLQGANDNNKISINQLTSSVTVEFLDSAKLEQKDFLTCGKIGIEKKIEAYLENVNLNLKTENLGTNENSSNDNLDLVRKFSSYNVGSTNLNFKYSKNLTKNEQEKQQTKICNVKLKDLIEDCYNESSIKNLKGQRSPKTFKKAFKCIDCNKSFYKKFMYEAHIKSVHENIEKPFSCPYCQTSFRLVQVLHRHMSCCQKINTDEICEYKVPQKPCHVCLRCQKTFKRKEHLKEHTRAVHEKLKPFKCGVCGKAFGTKNTLTRHEKNHSSEKPYSCEYCAKRYNSESELNVHIQRHTGNPNLLCPICKRAKQTLEELQEHISMHKSAYQCTTCGKIFKKMFHLKEHESTVHLKLRSLKCSYCNLTFTIRKTLKNHENSHNGVGRPEKCPLCELNFKSKRALSLHMKKTHVKES